MLVENVSTRIFHIVFFTYDSSAYVHFYDCNFRCKGCLRKLSIWDCHLPSDVASRLKFRGFLTLEGLNNVVVELISKYGMKRAVLGGGEPTTDPNLAKILRVLKGLNLDIAVLTNACTINENVMKEFVDPHVTVIVSIKSIDPVKHEAYTGFPLRPVLDNLIKMHDLNVKLLIETIAIPGFNDEYDIGELARFIASLDKSIPMIIDSFIPVPGAPWRRTTLSELERSEKAASIYLDNVYGRGKVIVEGLKGEVYLIFPEL